MIGKFPFSGQKCCSVLHSFRRGSSCPAGVSHAPHAGVRLGCRSQSPQSLGRSWRSAAPTQPCASACPWALAEEKALPEGVAVLPLSSSCRKSSSIAPSGFFFLLTCLCCCGDDPLLQDGLCLPAGHYPCELVAELLRDSQLTVSLCHRLVVLRLSAWTPWLPTACGVSVGSWSHSHVHRHHSHPQ